MDHKGASSFTPTPHPHASQNNPLINHLSMSRPVPSVRVSDGICLTRVPVKCCGIPSGWPQQILTSQCLWVTGLQVLGMPVAIRPASNYQCHRERRAGKESVQTNFPGLVISKPENPLIPGGRRYLNLAKLPNEIFAFASFQLYLEL